MTNIGFMQGRLSSIVDQKIQAFPWKEWEKEFPRAAEIGFSIMEWTIDFDNLSSNPIMTHKGRQTIQTLSQKYNISIPSLTGDCFMQKPFWKESKSNREYKSYIKLMSSSGAMKIGARCLARVRWIWNLG